MTPSREEYTRYFSTLSLKFHNDEQLTAGTWLTVLTRANEMLSGESSGTTTLDALTCAEHKLRDALGSGLNPVDAFGEVVGATEAFAVQTAHRPELHSTNSTRHKMYKYPDPEAHAACVWMRAAYEAVKLKCDCRFGT